MEAQGSRQWVGPFGGVHQCADRVEAASGDEKDGAGHADRGEELGRSDDPDPADSHVGNRVSPPRRFDPCELEQKAQRGARPNEDQDEPAGRAIEAEEREGRV